MKAKKILSILCALSMLAMLAAGCGTTPGEPVSSAGGGAASSTDGGASAPDAAEPDISERVELTLGGFGVGNSADDKYWPSTLLEEIQNKLNITIKTINYDSQKFNLDMASGQLCDLMKVTQKETDAVLKGRHALELDPYLDNIGKGLNDEYFTIRNNLMRECYSNGSGKLYFTTPSMRQGDFKMISGTVGYGHMVRWDYYDEIGHPDITDQWDYLDALKKMKANHPTTEDGLPTYAWGMYNDAGMQTWTYQGYLQLGFCALDSNANCLYTVNMQTNEFVPNMYNESDETPFWNDMHFYNEMYKAGLMDPDCFITKGEDVQGKYTKGQYLGGINKWYIGDYQNNVKADPDSAAGYVMLPAKKYMVGAPYPAGFTAQIWFVSAASKNAERAVMLLNYANTEEFARLSNNGIQGVHWDYNAEGVPELTEDIIDMQINGDRVEEYKKLGIGVLSNLCGIGGPMTLRDGKPASLWNDPALVTSTITKEERLAAEAFGVSSPGALGEKYLEEGKCVDESKWNSLAAALMPAAPDDVTRVDSNAVEIVTNALPSLVQAADDAAFQAAREKLMNDLKSSNIETSLQWWQENYNTALAQAEEIMG